jgi:hypothetical protein
MSAEQVTRPYVVSDAFALQYAKTLRGLFIADQAAFVNRDPSFGNPYEMDWDAAITDAENQPSDNTIEYQLAQKTDDVEEQMELCRNNFQDAKPFIKKAFPNKPATWEEFGFEDYDKVRKDQAEMVQFMKNFHSAAVKYSGQLIAVNFTQVMIDEIETRRAALNNTNNIQEQFKKERLSITETRITKLKAMWNFCQTVCETGKLIFRNQYAKYQQYLLPASDESTPMIVKGKVTQGGGTSPIPGTGTPATPVEDVNISVMELPGLTTQSDSNGNYGFGNIPAGTYTFNFNKAGYMPQSMPGVVITDIDHPVTLNVVMTPMP